jgi:hypothetical protein
MLDELKVTRLSDLLEAHVRDSNVFNGISPVRSPLESERPLEEDVGSNRPAICSDVGPMEPSDRITQVKCVLCCVCVCLCVTVSLFVCDDMFCEVL